MNAVEKAIGKQQPVLTFQEQVEYCTMILQRFLLTDLFPMTSETSHGFPPYVWRIACCYLGINTGWENSTITIHS